jgi:HAMP domain-containing protein
MGRPSLPGPRTRGALSTISLCATGRLEEKTTMNPLDLIKGRLAIRVSLTVGAVMIALIVMMGWLLARQQSEEHVDSMQEFLLTKAKSAAISGAKAYSTVLEEAVDNGVLLVTEATDTGYKVIEGYEWGKAPKFHTQYDSVTDKAVLLFQDKYLEDKDFLYAFGMDKNGYVPTHNSLFQKAVTGDPDTDFLGNRSKRILDDEVSKLASKNEKTEGEQRIYRGVDGKTIWDVSAPINVKGIPWGVFRIGVTLERVGARQAAMASRLTVWFAFFIVLVLAVLLVVLSRSMKPVQQLTKAADAISAGEDLEVSLKVDRADEIGKLARSLDRLRLSMKAAIERLGGV